MRGGVANAAQTGSFFPGKTQQPDRTRFHSGGNAEEDQGVPPRIAQCLLIHVFNAFPPLQVLSDTVSSC